MDLSAEDFMNLRNFGEDDILQQIEELVVEITEGDCGIIINLRNVSFNESRSSVGSSTLFVSNIFFNDEGRLCADLYRSGGGGFFDFICGIGIEDVRLEGLYEILHALRNSRWTLSEQPVAQKKTRRRRLPIPVRIPFHLKGA